MQLIMQGILLYLLLFKLVESLVQEAVSQRLEVQARSILEIIWTISAPKPMLTLGETRAMSPSRANKTS